MILSRVGAGVMRHVIVNRNISENRAVKTPIIFVKICSTVCNYPTKRCKHIYLRIEPDECLERTHSCGYYGSDVGIMGHPHHFRPTAQFQLNGSTVSQILDLARYAKLLISLFPCC